MDKKVSLMIFSIIMIFMVSGCSAVKSPKDLMKRPKISAVEREIEDIIEKFLTEGKTLTLTLGQKNRESIRRFDLDGDGSEEILLLYKDGEYRNEYGVIMLKKKDNKWYEINRIKGAGNGIDLIDYSDITGDGKPEVFIGWNRTVENELQNSKKILGIHTYHNGYFESIDFGEYINFGVYDLNNDRVNELVLLRKLDENSVKTLEVLNYLKGELLSVDKFLINNLSYDNIMTFGKVSKEQKGIFIDFYIEDRGAYTDLFILKDNKLVEVFENESTKSYKTYQVYKVGSKDINNDNIIEIGTLTQLEYVEEIPEYETPWINLWYQWDGRYDLKLVKREYYNYDMEFKIDIPDKWGNRFTIRKFYDENNVESKVDFFNINNESHIEALFLSIERFNTEQWQEKVRTLQDNKYVILKENDEDIIVGIIESEVQKERYLITKEKLKEMFQDI